MPRLAKAAAFYLAAIPFVWCASIFVGVTLGIGGRAESGLMKVIDWVEKHFEEFI